MHKDQIIRSRDPVCSIGHGYFEAYLYTQVRNPLKKILLYPEPPLQRRITQNGCCIN